MNFTSRLTRSEFFAVLSLVIVALGFIGLAVGYEYFFLIWALGFAVILPLVVMLFGNGETEKEQSEDDLSIESSPDSLTTLRDRYARGDLTDEEFERKLDYLFETDSPENAAEWRELATEKAQ